MKKRGRSTHNDSYEELLIKLCFKEEVDENNLFLGASLAYFFGVLFACLTQEVEPYFGIILILTAIMIVWYLRDKRKEILRKYEKQIESLKAKKHKT
jgi:Ca2+/Na+ antiporter